jgi:RNA polymerase sigma factor (sigma-70 family)
MHDLTDAELLEQYRRGSGDAFAALVRRHIDWVWSVARRRLRDAHLAEDVTQAVFVTLARKPPRLWRGSPLSPWLLKVVNLTCLSTMRREYNRLRRETEAARMKSLSATPEPRASWDEVAPHLDELVERLPSRHRTIIMLRFYEQKSFTEIAELIGITEDAARKRVSRSVEALRSMLSRRGVSMPAAALGVVLVAEAVKPAPAAIAAAGAAAAIHGPGATAGFLSLVGVSNAKIVTAIGLVCLLLSGAGLGVAVHRSSPSTGPTSVADNPTASSLPTSAPSEDLAFILDQMKQSREKVKNIYYEISTDATFDWSGTRIDDRPARSRFKEIHELATILHHGSSFRARLLSRRIYDDEKLNHLWDQRCVLTDQYAAVWIDGSVAMVEEHHSQSEISEDFLNTNSSLMWNDFDACFGLSDVVLSRFDVRVTKNTGTGKDQLILLSMYSHENLVVKLEIDPSNGYLTHESTMLDPTGATRAHKIAELKEIAPSVWFPVSLQQENADLHSKSKSTASAILLNPLVDVDAFEPAKALNLPDGTRIQHLDLDGNRSELMMQDGKAIISPDGAWIPRPASGTTSPSQAAK